MGWQTDINILGNIFSHIPWYVHVHTCTHSFTVMRIYCTCIIKIRHFQNVVIFLLNISLTSTPHLPEVLSHFNLLRTLVKHSRLKMRINLCSLSKPHWNDSKWMTKALSLKDKEISRILSSPREMHTTLGKLKSRWMDQCLWKSWNFTSLGGRLINTQTDLYLWVPEKFNIPRHLEFLGKICKQVWLQFTLKFNKGVSRSLPYSPPSWRLYAILMERRNCQLKG